MIGAEEECWSHKERIKKKKTMIGIFTDKNKTSPWPMEMIM